MLMGCRHCRRRVQAHPPARAAIATLVSLAHPSIARCATSERSTSLAGLSLNTPDVPDRRRYEKPTDFKRKRLNLLSVKPLYLHLELALNGN